MCLEQSSSIWEDNNWLPFVSFLLQSSPTLLSSICSSLFSLTKAIWAREQAGYLHLHSGSGECPKDEISCVTLLGSLLLQVLSLLLLKARAQRIQTNLQSR